MPFNTEEILTLSKRIEEIIQIGSICELDKKGRSLVRVELANEFVSDFVPLMQVSTPICAVWVPPQIGEQVILLSPNGEAGQGVVIRGIYNTGRKEPEDKDKNNAIIEFKDGNKIIYEDGNLTINTTKNVEVKAGEKTTITAETDVEVTANGNTTITAEQNVTVEAKGKVEVKSGDITLGDGLLPMGVVTRECKCVMTGSPHIEASTQVKAVK